MAPLNQQDPKQLYIQTYTDALSVLIRKTKAKNERLPVNDMINHALKLAQYKTYMTTGVNISKINFGTHTERMHELAGGSRVGKRFDKQINNIMRQTQFGYGSAAGTMTAKTIGREVREFFLRAPEAKEDLLKTLGMTQDALLTGASPLVKMESFENKKFKLGDPEMEPAAVAQRSLIRQEAEAVTRDINNKLNAKNPANYDRGGLYPTITTEKVNRELSTPVGDLFHNNVDFTGRFNPQQEHTYIEDVLKRYTDDPYTTSKKNVLRTAGEDSVPVLDAFGDEIRLRVIPESNKSQLFPAMDAHEFEQGFFDKILKAESEYQRQDVFFGLLSHEKGISADQMRADIQVAREIAGRHLTRVKQDGRELRTISEMLQIAKKQKAPLASVIGREQFSDTRIAKFVTGRLTEEGLTNDRAVIMELANFMRKELFIRQSVLDSDTLRIGTMQKAVNRSIRDLYNPMDTNFYERTNVYRRFMKDYNGMIDDLKERRGVIGSEFQAYADFGINRTSDGGLLSREETASLHAETTKHLRDLEFGDKVASQIDEDVRAAVGTTNNQRVRNLILEQLETTDSKAGNKLKHSLINVVEGNIEALTTFAKDDTPEAIKFADQLFAEKLRTRLMMAKNSPWKNLTDEGVNAIIQGFGIDRTDLKSTRANIAEIEAKARKPLTTVLETKRQLQNDRLAMWRDAAYQQEMGTIAERERYLRVPGRQGRFQIETDARGKALLDEEKVVLRSEFILPQDIAVKVPVDHERIHTIMDEFDTLKYNQEMGRQYNYERAQQTIKESFVTLRYQHQMVNEDLKEQYKDFYEKLVRLDQNMHVGMKPEEIYTAREAAIPLKNLLEPYNRYTSRAGEDTAARLPNFMKSMINNELSYMRRPGEEAQLASMAYMSLVDAIESLPEDRVVDLSDEGMLRRFLNQPGKRTQEEIDAFMGGLNNRGLVDRWDDFISDIAKQKMYGQFYAKLDATERRSAGQSVVNDVVQHLRSEYGKTNSREFAVTPSNVRSYVQRIGSDLREMPFYKEALEFSEAEIADIIKEGELGNRFFSFEDYFQRLMDDADREDTHGFRVGTIDDETLNVPESRESILGRYMDKDAEVRPGDFSKQNAERLAKEMELTPVNSYNSLDYLYNVNRTINPNASHLDALVNFEGKQYEARIRMASGGEMFAHIPALNRSIFIPRHESEARRTYSLHEIEPQASAAGRTVKEITYGGGVRRSSIGDYMSIQQGVQADPSDTFDLVKQMMTGKKNGVYFDMETTGLSGSTLDPKLIQPLEIYMQEAQWNTRANDFYRVKGEVGVRNNGRTRKVAEHIFIQPSQDVINFATEELNGLTARPNSWGFMLNGKRMNVLDVLNAKARDDGAYVNLRKQIMSQEGGVELMKRVTNMEDRLWFLRNIAKYSGNEETFQSHIGYRDAEMTGENLLGYLNQLREDTQKALHNFEINPKTGKLNLFTEMPDFRRAKVMTPDQAVEAYANFTRNRIVMGQNVAEADVQKIVGMADNFVESAKAEVMMQKNGIIDALTRDFEAVRDPIHDSYATLVHPEDPTRRFSLLPGNEVDSILNAQSATIEPGMVQSLSEAFGDNRELMSQAMQDVAQRNHGGDVSALRQYMEDPTDGLNSIFVVPQSTASADRRIAQETLIQQFRDADANEMIRLMQEHGVGDLTRYHTATGLRAEVAAPQVMEQMFAASYALPGLRRRNAETVMQALGFNINQAQHTAAADVGEGLQVFRELFKRMSANEEFQKYDGELLRAGDFVQHYSAADPSLPLGIYEIEHVGTDQMGMRSVRFGTNGEVIRGDSHALVANNPIDLNRRYQLNFEFLGDVDGIDQARAAYTEFAEDQARRQISRASQSMFNFDRYELQSTSGDGPNALGRLETYRESMTGEPGSGFSKLIDETRNPLGDLIATPEQQAALEPLLNRTALDSQAVFNREDFKQLANWDISLAKRSAFDVGAAGFYKSEEGKARRAFLAEVDAMQTYNVITNQQGRDLIRSMNASIIEAGRKAGNTRVPIGVAHAGVMTDVFGGMAGDQMTLNISTTNKLQQGLYSYAERIMKERGEGSVVNGLYMLESERKAEALNNVLFPFLRERGLIEYEDKINISEAVRQIMDRPVVSPGAELQRGQLQQFEEYDFLAYRGRTQAEEEAFAGQIKNLHDNLLQPYREGLGSTHQDLIQQRIDDINTLKAHDMYEPNMVIKPDVDWSRADITTLSLSDFGGPKQWDTSLMERALERTKGSGIVEDVELRNNIMNELFERATAGRPNSVEGLIGDNLTDPGRMEAARLLGWIEQDDKGVWKQTTDIGSMRFGNQHYTGKNNPRERFSATQIRDLPMPVIENILAQDYTESSADSLLQGLLYQYTHRPGADGEWMETNWRDTHAGPSQIPIERRKRTREVSAQDLIEAGVPEDRVPSHLEDMVRMRKEMGEAAAQRRGVYDVTDVDMSKRVRDPGAIGTFVSDARQTVREFVGEGGAGHSMARGAAWVAGIGIAAYALKQFATAGGPLKFEHRPQGHGVEGIGANGDNDDMNRNDNVTAGPSTGGKAYVGAQGSNRGFSIRARAKNNGNIDHQDVTSDLQADIGSFNVNLRDDRQKMDRDWMTNQMDQYITRGHLG